MVRFQKRIPITSPDHFDTIPTGSSENRLQLLDDLAVASYRTIESLQVAVDDERQIIKLITSRQTQAGDRFRFVHLAVSEKTPDMRLRGVDDPAMFQVAKKSGLINAHD